MSHLPTPPALPIRRSTDCNFRRRVAPLLAVALAVTAPAACRKSGPADRVRVSGHVEADDVQVAPEVGGRILTLKVAEGDRVNAGDLIATLDTRDTVLALARSRADRSQADAQVRLLLAGSRIEDVRQSEAQAEAAQADVAAAEAELSNSQTDLERYEALLRANAGSQKARDDAKARRDVAAQKLTAAKERARAARETAARIKAGSRKEEIDAARARLAMVDAQIATQQKAMKDATVLA